MKQSGGAKQIRGKQIVYRYNGDPKYDEVVSDVLGSVPFLHVGDLLRKNGKQWKVAVVRDDLDMPGSSTAVTIHRVFLTDRL
jgi:hypothetical protein